jgi:hypothetical protein
MEERETGSSPENSGGETERTNITSADVGKRVAFFSSQDKKEKYGTLRYYGRPEFAAGVWCGVELDRPDGKNNGSKHGIRYFTCGPACGVFVPEDRVELDTSRRSRSRPSSRPSSRPNSRPSSAERGRKAASTGTSSSSEGSRVRPAAVQQELARLAQAPVAEQLARRKAAQSSVTNWRQPLKAFAQSKDDAAINKRSAQAHVTPFRTGGRSMHRAASSENLRGLKENSKTVKKSSSERNLQAGNTLPRSSIKSSGKKHSHQSVPSDGKQSVQQWLPVSAAQNAGRETCTVICSPSSSTSPSPDHNSTDNGYAPPSQSTHSSQLAELERRSVGMCPVPAVSKSNAAEQPSDPAPQSIVQLLTELVEQNRELCKRQGNCMLLHYSSDRCYVFVGVLERQLEASGKQHAELTRAVGTLKHCVEQSMHTTISAQESHTKQKPFPFLQCVCLIRPRWKSCGYGTRLNCRQWL